MTRPVLIHAIMHSVNIRESTAGSDEHSGQVSLTRGASTNEFRMFSVSLAMVIPFRNNKYYDELLNNHCIVNVAILTLNGDVTYGETGQCLTNHPTWNVDFNMLDNSSDMLL